MVFPTKTVKIRWNWWCKIFSLKIRRRKILDKFHVWRSDVFTIAFLYTSTFPTYYFNPFFHKVFGIEWRCSQANRSCWPVEVAGLGGWGEGGVGVGVNFIFSWLPSISWKVAIETNQRGIFTLAWWISLMLYVKSFFSNKLSILVEINVFKEEAIWSHSLVLSLIFSSKCKTLPYVEVETTHNYNGFSNALITTRSSRMNVAPISNHSFWINPTTFGCPTDPSGDLTGPYGNPTCT